MYYSLAMSLYQETDAALAMVSEVATAGYPEEALALLGQATRVLAKQDARTLKRSRLAYESDIAYLKGALAQAMESENTVTDLP